MYYIWWDYINITKNPSLSLVLLVMHELYFITFPWCQVWINRNRSSSWAPYFASSMIFPKFVRHPASSWNFHVFDSPSNVAFLMLVSLTRFTGLATMVLASTTTMGGSDIKWLKAEISLPVWSLTTTPIPGFFLVVVNMATS